MSVLENKGVNAGVDDPRPLYEVQVIYHKAKLFKDRASHVNREESHVTHA